MNDFLIFQHQVVIAVPANAFKTFLFYKKTLVPKAEIIHIKAGKPSIGFQEPVIMVKRKAVAAGIKAFIQLLHDIMNKTLRWTSIGMQKVKSVIPGQACSKVQLASTSLIRSLYKAHPSFQDFKRGEVRAATIGNNNLHLKVFGLVQEKIQQGAYGSFLIKGGNDDGKRIFHFKGIFNSTLRQH